MTIVQTPIAPGHWLDKPAADSYKRAQARGMPAGINDAGRTYQEQIDMFLKNYTSNYASSSKLDRRVWNGTAYWRRAPYTRFVSAAVPGTSRHEVGNAIDLPDAPRAWFRQHGNEHGFFNPEWAKDVRTLEPWHWEYNESSDQHLNEGTQEDFMYWFKKEPAPSKVVWLYTGTGTTQLNQAEYNLLERLARQRGVLPQDDLDPMYPDEIAVIDAALTRTVPASSGSGIDVVALVNAIVKGVVDGITKWFTRP